MAWRRWRRWFLVLGLLVVGVPLAYLLASLGLSAIPVHGSFVEPPPGQGVEIQLVSNGIHVDFLLPTVTEQRDWSRDFPPALFPGVDDAWEHVLIGWGDRGFYLETPTWADLKGSTAVRAVCWPSDTVVHVRYVRRRFEDSTTTPRIRLDEDAYSRLCGFIEASFRTGATGELLPIPGRAYGAFDHFFEGAGHYHAFNTCNSWTVRGLDRAGVRTALWSPFPQGVLWHVP